MEKRIKDFSEEYSNFENMAYRNRFNSRTEMPECLSGDFCISAPRDRNGGILTMAFVDMQPLDEVYSLNEAFCNGTLFPNLNKPFYGGRR